MSEPVLIALIVSTVGPSVVFVLGRVFGGWRRDQTEHEVSVSAQWEAWSREQGRRIDALEADVQELKRELDLERSTSKALKDQNARQAAMLTALVRWAILLRDEVIRLGGNLPPAPVEVEAAMTTLEP